MTELSILIPARVEEQVVNGRTVLWQTVEDLLDHTASDCEILVGFDGPPYQNLPEDRRVRGLYWDQPIGGRAVLNALAAAARGAYLLKSDAHCAFSPGFDRALLEAAAPETIVVPRLYNLDMNAWTRLEKEVIDYYYLTCPWTHPRHFQMQSAWWTRRSAEQRAVPIDEIMAFGGSCWLMPAAYWRALGGLAPDGVYGAYAEHQELSLKCWLGGGRILVQKGCWYAHQERWNSHRGFPRAISQFHQSHVAVARYFCQNRWPGAVHRFEWLIEHFWPLPTEATLAPDGPFFWPEDWRRLVDQGDPRERRA